MEGINIECMFAARTYLFYVWNNEGSVTVDCLKCYDHNLNRHLATIGLRIIIKKYAIVSVVCLGRIFTISKLTALAYKNFKSLSETQ